DYDHSKDFSKYHTFMWIRQPKPENPLMKQRIIDAVNAQLEAKGLRLVEEGADLGIAVHTATREQHTLDNFYDGFPGWGWYRWGGYWADPQQQLSKRTKWERFWLTCSILQTTR